MIGWHVCDWQLHNVISIVQRDVAMQMLRYMVQEIWSMPHDFGTWSHGTNKAFLLDKTVHMCNLKAEMTYWPFLIELCLTNLPDQPSRVPHLKLKVVHLKIIHHFTRKFTIIGKKAFFASRILSMGTFTCGLFTERVWKSQDRSFYFRTNFFMCSHLSFVDLYNHIT